MSRVFHEKDYAGNKYGKLTVIRFAEREGSRKTFALCICECGTEQVFLLSNLKNGHTKSCGCSKGPKLNESDYVGKRYGRFTVLAFDRVSNLGRLMAKCQCDCGAVKTVELSAIQCGSIKSCGCYKMIAGHFPNPSNATHGKSSERIYKIWVKMRARCTNPKATGYEGWGGRGITVCDEWLNDFTAFYDWSMENGYSDKLTIDRKDNDGPYAPWNCRWATQKEQGNNTRVNVLVTCRGKTQTVSEWADETGLNYGTLISRLRYGWSEEAALFTPPRKTSRIY